LRPSQKLGLLRFIIPRITAHYRIIPRPIVTFARVAALCTAMGALTEIEIFDQMATSLKEAAACADEIASRSERGPAYDRMRHALRRVEGCCRQASTWREDTRWLPIGRMMAEAHARAGSWLRGYKVHGVRVAFGEGQKNQLFVLFAANLRDLLNVIETLRTKATGRVGMILPEPLVAPHRDTRPVGWRAPMAGSIIIPAGVHVG
jgi:hypothetical protein